MTESAAGRQEIWVEKYRPERLADVVGHEAIISRVKSYVARDDVPHLLFAGPAGTGKCLTGATPILTNNGIKSIKSVVGEADGFESPPDDLEVVTFGTDGSFKFDTPASVFSKETSEVVTVRTRDGNSFEVTPEHPLLVVDESGLEWTEAGDLQPGMRIARPRRVPVPESDERLEWFERLDGERIFVHVEESFARNHSFPVEENFVGKKRVAIRCLRTGYSVEEAASEADLTRKTVSEYRRELQLGCVDETPSTVSLGYLREHFEYTDLSDVITGIQYVNANNGRSRSITPPDRLDPELARFVGLVLSEARIDNGRIRFYNTDGTLLDRFESTLVRRFDLEPERTSRKGVPMVKVQSQTLVHYLTGLFDVLGDGIGSRIVRADEDSRAAFLRAMFDAEAYVSPKGAIELTQKDGDTITALGYLLTSFGIPSRRKRELKAAMNGSGKEREYHTLIVSGGDALSQFESEIGFSIEEKRETLSRLTGQPANPNHDTLPMQDGVDALCRRLRLTKGELLGNLDTDDRARMPYQAELRAVTSAARDRLSAANRALEVLEEIQTALSVTTATPSKWLGERREMQPLARRKKLTEKIGTRPDRLLEYSDGRRTPRASRVGEILGEFGHPPPETETLQQSLREVKQSLGVSYETVADGTGYRGLAIQEVLDRSDHALKSLSRFEVVVDRLETIANEMLSVEVLGYLREIELLASAELYFDEVVETTRRADSTTVYDLTIPKTHNFVAGEVPTVMHNTATATAIAKELYGEDWRENFLELNASDERGIDVVRDRIKNFARTSFGEYNYRIIFLDEADALTSDAQSALRRTMEQFSNNTRFILSCNYSSQIIDPIQSRCAVFRFSPLDDESVIGRIRDIADEEGIEYTEEGLDALVYAADGDMRKAINALQAASATGDVVDEDVVYSITSTARPEEIEAMVTTALQGDFTGARAKLSEMITDRGLAGGDIIDQLHRSVWEFDLDDEAAVHLMDRLGEADYRISSGANEQVQLEALLASIALAAKEDGEQR